MFSFDQIVNKPVLFTAASQIQLSEMLFLVKFWGPVIELFFDAKKAPSYKLYSKAVHANKSYSYRGGG